MVRYYDFTIDADDEAAAIEMARARFAALPVAENYEIIAMTVETRARRPQYRVALTVERKEEA